MTEYYVDADTGSDANDGTSWGAAKQTFAAGYALPGSGDALRIRGDHTISSQLARNASYFPIIGDSGASVTWDTAGDLFDANNGYQDWYSIALNIGSSVSAGGINIRDSGVYDCEILIASTLANWWSDVNTQFHRCVFRNDDSPSIVYAPYGQDNVFSECEFYEVSIHGTPNYQTFDRCKFGGNGTAIVDHASGIHRRWRHCSVWNMDYFHLGQNPQIYSVLAACVFGHPTASYDPAFVQMARMVDSKWGYEAQIRHLTDSAEYNDCVDSGLTTNNVAETHDVTTLSSQPYADPDNGDWTLSAELAALVTTGGLTPGAIQAAGSGGGTTSKALRLGNRLHQAGITIS